MMNFITKTVGEIPQHIQWMKLDKTTKPPKEKIILTHSLSI
jgi:hypothetical protein